MTFLLEGYSEHEGGDLVLEHNGMQTKWELQSSIYLFIFLYWLPYTTSFTLLETHLKRDEPVEEPKNPLYDLEAFALCDKKMDLEFVTFAERRTRKRKAEEDRGSNVNWILFYTDVEHWVEPVISGTRIVLQFDVMVPAVAQEPAHDAFFNRSDGKGEPEKDGKEDTTHKPDIEKSNTSSEGIELERPEHKPNEEEEEESNGVYEADGEEEEESDGVYKTDGEDPFDCSHPLKPGRFTALDKTRFYEISNFLKANLSPTTAITIPLFYLYTSQTIVPERLKDIDRILFDLLISEGFSVSIAPIVFTSTTDYEGSFDGVDAYVDVQIRDLPLQVYEASESSVSGLKAYRLSYWPGGVSNTYVYTGLEAKEFIDGTEYQAQTGNEPQQGSNTYLSGGMVIFKTK